MSTMLAPVEFDLAALGASVHAALAKTEQPPPSPPKVEAPRQIIAPATLEEAIDETLDLAKVSPGEGPKAKAKRKTIAQALAAKIMALPVYEVELADARAEIGDPVGFDNATVFTDGSGRATRIVFDASYVLWDQQ